MRDHETGFAACGHRRAGVGRDARAIVDRGKEQGLDGIGEGLGMRGGRVGVERALILPNLEGDKMTRWRDALKCFGYRAWRRTRRLLGRPAT